ncbi:MAG: 50S ribosomal protein L23 [Myxococcales bacterium]|nr:50S ribosomal protein L23 [Myxococcales bacterium]
MSALLRLIEKPIVSEKAELLRDSTDTYTFAVAIDANKRQIAAAVKAAFDVEVIDVRTSIVRGKTRRMGGVTGRRKNWKKAYVRVADGQIIEALEPVEEIPDFEEEN